MIATEHSQSVADFKQNSAETFDRLRETGEPEVLTVDGEPKAVLLSPAAYGELAREIHLIRAVESSRRSMAQFDAGQGMELNAFMDQVRAKLLAIKAEQERGPK